MIATLDRLAALNEKLNNANATDGEVTVTLQTNEVAMLCRLIGEYLEEAEEITLHA